MKVDFEVLTDVRKGEMFAICLNDTLVHLESQGGKKKTTKKKKTTQHQFGRYVSCFQKQGWAESVPTGYQRACSSAQTAEREQQMRRNK